MKTKAITEGAMLCALAVIMALLSNYVPFLTLFFIFIPVPVVILAKKQGLNVSIIASIAAILILVILTDPISAALYGAYMLFVGCGLGVTYHKNKSGFIKLGAAYVGSLCAIVFVIILAQVLSGQNFITMLTQVLDSSAKEAINLYSTMGLSGDQLTQAQSLFEQVTETMKLLIPTSFLVTPFFVGFGNIVLSDVILRRIKIENKALSPMSQWQLPASFKNFLMVVIISLLVINIFKIEGIPVIYTYTLTMIVYTLYFMMGLSFAFWFINRKKPKESMGLKLLVVAGCMLIPILTNLISFVGVADIYINIRRLIENQENKSI